MYVTLTLAKYPKYLSWAGVLSMALFHIPLFINNRISFYKLLGCGKGNTFNKNPNWQLWATLVVHKIDNSNNLPSPRSTSKFINFYYQLFKVKKVDIVLQPIVSHGLWSGKKCFEAKKMKPNENEPIAVLTRATIRWKKLKDFWQNVPKVASSMITAEGLVFSLGIGEVPFVKQATFSIWQSSNQMQEFAYKMQEHKEVITKTRELNWYKEEMFTRFKIISCSGFINNITDLQSFTIS